ncbi:Mitochondrial acidic protein mam33 [Mycoemilia scoparia]|uniref:Mitochondrial acidic protein mam33 n=1 Tax=Mycoemilia scoparia TaxID=417184 RepID=A0A9W8ABV1_9FUNG|nr:Mitochondrial acidic protein mam33 [Mycoemilia scoparia]
MNLLRTTRPLAARFLKTPIQRVTVKGFAQVRPAFSSQKLSLAVRGFGTTVARFEGSQSDKDITHTLQEEIEYERNALEEEGEPEFIKSFVEKTGFEIKESTGLNDVLLTKKFGNETIHVRFSVSEILNSTDNMADVEVFNENPEGVKKTGETNADETPDEFPVSFSVSIVKPGHANVLSLDLVAEEGEIGVDRIMFFPNEATALEQTAERDWERRGHYVGPVFGHLSDDLKENIDVFLEERGIETGLCLFMQDYIEHKEEKEYLGWLENFQKFVKA